VTVADIEVFRQPFRSTLQPLDGLPARSTVVLGDEGGCWLVGEPGRWVRREASGEVRTFEHPCRDRWGDPVQPTSACRERDGQILACTFARAWLLRPDEPFTALDQWDLRSERSMATSTQVACDPAGRTRVAIARDHLLRLLPKGETTFVRDDDDPFWGLAVSPDGLRIAHGHSSGRIELRDADTLQVLTTLEGSSDPALAMAFSPDGTKLAVADDQTQLLLFDLPSGQLTYVQGLSKVVGLLWMPDSSGFLAVCLSQQLGVVELSDPSSARLVRPEHDFERRYLDAGALVGPQTVVLRV
jgi:WD40 repeat protein